MIRTLRNIEAGRCGDRRLAVEERETLQAWDTLRSQLDAVTKERGELRQRVQQAEKAARTTIDDCRRQGVSLGRSLANYACKMERHRAERMERVVEAARRWADACATGDDDLEEDALRDAVRALDATPTREDE